MVFAAGQTLPAPDLETRIATLETKVAKISSFNTSWKPGGTTTSVAATSALSVGTTPGVVFTAPASGSVQLLYQSEIANSGAAIGIVNYEVRAGGTIGSGALFSTVTDDDCLQHTGTATESPSHHTFVSGLTAGATYNAQLLVRVGAGTGTFTRQRLSVMPV